MQKRRKNNNKKEKKRIRPKIVLILQILLLLFLMVMAGGLFYFYQTYGRTILQLQSEAKKMVNESTYDTFKATQTSLVYDAEGNLISTLKGEKDVYYMEYNDIPTMVFDALVVSEDRKFLEHDGVDYWANIRAAVALIKNKGEITQGASTITQQLGRNIFLTHEVTYERKIKEIFVAQELEKKYLKYEIMEYYINGIYFANGHYGIQAAAQGYFGKSASGLSLSQIAFLCAIPNNPNRYNPVTNMEKTLERRDRLLLQMLEDKKINRVEYLGAISEIIALQQEKAEKKNYVETYAYYSAIRALMKLQGFEFRYQFVNEEERQSYEDDYYDLYYRYQKDLYVRGYRIYTSIDLEKQKLLQESFDNALQDFTEVNEEGVYQLQGAAVCIDNDNGRVIAIVGGRGQDLKGYTLNRGYQSYRQPGSAIKPLIVYTPIFERKYTPESIVLDERFEGGPKNSGGNYTGEMKLQRAIEVSKNTIAWKLFEELTPTVGLSYLMEMNFARVSDRDYVPAASLGGFTVGVSPVEMAAAYATLENEGYYREPSCIVKIMDSEGNEIVGDTMKAKAIYETNAAKIMTEALTGVMKYGTGKGLGLTNSISAGKTGTTDDKKDGWFVGYTPYYTTSVWVGYDLPRRVEGLTGSSYPGTIWKNFMEQLHDSSMTKEFSFYDWRAVLKQEQEKERKEKEKIAKEETAQREELRRQEEALANETQEQGMEDQPIDSEDENYGAEKSEDENIVDENIEDENIEAENFDDENSEDENIEDENIEDENIEDENIEAENTEDVTRNISLVVYRNKRGQEPYIEWVPALIFSQSRLSNNFTFLIVFL